MLSGLIDKGQWLAMHFPEIKTIPEDIWNEIASKVLGQIRAEKGIPEWEPKLLNGSYEFEERMLAYYRTYYLNSKS
jgi:hypothetical protein